MEQLARTDYISWDQYFMGVADLAAMRSKDPSTQVGACIANVDNHIVGVGYNGMPVGFTNTSTNDNRLPWGREGKYLDTKYPYVCHAELNAILNSISKLQGCKIYVSLFPCNECAKLIVQSGITEVIYKSDKYADVDMCIAARRIFDTFGVVCRPYIVTGKEIKLTL